MDIYNNLIPEVQKQVILRCCIITTLMLMSVYCITITALFHNTYWLIVCLVLNVLECLISVDVLWKCIELNNIEQRQEEIYPDLVLYLLTIVMTILYYCLGSYQLYELAYIIFCSAFCYGVIVYCFGIAMIDFFQYCIQAHRQRIERTIQNINERQRLIDLP